MIKEAKDKVNQKEAVKAERKFPTKFTQTDTLEVQNPQPGFVYRWCRADFAKTGKPAPELRGWIPVNHNLGDTEFVSGKAHVNHEGLVVMRDLILCKSTMEWKADRDAIHERQNALKAPAIQQKATDDLERMKFSVVGGLDVKKSKLIK